MRGLLEQSAAIAPGLMPASVATLASRECGRDDIACQSFGECAAASQIQAQGVWSHARPSMGCKCDSANRVRNAVGLSNGAGAGTRSSRLHRKYSIPEYLPWSARPDS